MGEKVRRGKMEGRKEAQALVLLHPTQDPQKSVHGRRNK